MNRFHYLHVVQGRYDGPHAVASDHGWEDLCQSTSRKEARHDLQLYKENEPEFTHRMIQRREPNPDWTPPTVLKAPKVVPVAVRRGRLAFGQQTVRGLRQPQAPLKPPAALPLVRPAVDSKATTEAEPKKAVTSLMGSPIKVLMILLYFVIGILLAFA